jgi:ABC-type nitrate/sulfonate/bicarbonate transport system ATPase subunit
MSTAEEIPARTKPPITVRELERTFDSTTHKIVAFKNVSLDVDEGEFVTIVGPSGCGKTTLLNVIAGLLEPTHGQVLLQGESQASRAQHVGYMFQKDLLLPWRNIRGNVALGLEIQGLRKKEARSRADQLIDHFGLKGFGHQYPSQLSGGMRQRAALMRTLVCGRPILLLDEPFGALDALTRTIMQEWLLQIWAETRSTVLFITHDIEEAVFLSDRVFVMTARPGQLKAEIPVDLPRPRTYGAVTSPAFVALKEKLLGLIHEEGVKAIES